MSIYERDRMARSGRRRCGGLRMTTVLVWCLTLGAALLGAAAPARAADAPELDAGFRLLYELKFNEARAQFANWEKAHPDDPLGSASEAASYLFEEFCRLGVLTSEFFLDDKRLLGGAAIKADAPRRAAFTAANLRAKELARRRLKTNPRDPDALFALTISTGMQADYTSLIEKRQFESLKLIREAEGHAKTLLALQPDSADAYLALGAANYIIGCLPGYKRAFLWFGGIHGDRPGGMQQLRTAATRGHYLRPFAKMLLALAALREKQVELARTQLRELNAEFPQNALFARELAKLPKPAAALPSTP
jgi:hypothetical protein